MVIGKSIRVYLADATVTGIRYAELVNWTGHAIACPRNRLSELASWPEAAKPGVYFLFESRVGDDKPLAYIGESENVAQRLTTHDRNKDFWNEVVVFTSKDENLTKAHIKHLEAMLVGLSKSADRYKLENGNCPPESSLPRADRDAMAEFVENVRMVLGILGYQILEPILKTRVSLTIPSLELESPVDSNVSNLIFRVNGVVAYGALTDEGFVLKKGSQLCRLTMDSMPTKLLAMRTRLLSNGSITDNGIELSVADDILLSSSSYAAAMVAGTSRSGPQSWKSLSGRTLKELEDASILAM